MRENELFQKLPYCLRKYIEGKRWKSFREVQLKAFEVLDNTEDHLLISAGTSSGKTEAALFPVISNLYNNKPKRIGALYISPLIALIDDQFDRVSKMIEDSFIPLNSWHGDISSSRKRTILSSGSGILQITPESLDRIVTMYFDKAVEMFADLRYVIIDEVHTFMNSDRGLHLLCELETIERLSKCSPRRIGLSATLSEEGYFAAENWLKGNTKKDVSLIQCTERPVYELHMSFNGFASKKEPEKYQKSLMNFYKKVYDDSSDYNCLIFANDRNSVEELVKNLKFIGKERKSKKQILAHHSSVSKEYRKLAEEKLKDSCIKCTAVATSTLELGIDIGDIDRVLHINSPNSVSSLIQKLGRSGRRNGRPVMYCYFNNKRASPIDGIEFDLIKGISEAELCLNKHWIEPIRYSVLPYSLLFHQILGYIKSRYTVKLSELRENVFSLFPFRNMDSNDFELMIGHLLSTSIIEYNPNYDAYCLGEKGDKIVTSEDFTSVFPSIRELKVINDEKKEVGSVQDVPQVGDIIQLSGESWAVNYVDFKSRTIKVSRALLTSETFWKSGKADVNTKIITEMYYCLNSSKNYDYLDDSANYVLFRSRRTFESLCMSNQIVDCGDYSILYPWLGSIQFVSLFRVLEAMKIADRMKSPYEIIIKSGYSIETLKEKINEFLKTHAIIELVDDKDLLETSWFGKYNEYVPDELLRKQYCEDRIDLDFELDVNKR